MNYSWVEGFWWNWAFLGRRTPIKLKLFLHKEQVLLNTNNMLVIITHFSNENRNTATYHYSVVAIFKTIKYVNAVRAVRILQVIPWMARWRELENRDVHDSRGQKNIKEWTKYEIHRTCEGNTRPQLVLIGGVFFFKRSRWNRNTNYWWRYFCIKQTSGSKRTSWWRRWQ